MPFSRLRHSLRDLMHWSSLCSLLRAYERSTCSKTTRSKLKHLLNKGDRFGYQIFLQTCQSLVCVFPADHSLWKRSLQVCFRGFPEFSFSRMSSRIFENVTAKWTFCVQQFFFSKIAIIEARSATIAFFSSPPFFLLALSFFFSFPFPSLVWVRSLSGPRNPPFNAFSLKWRQILLGWFSKNRWQS